MKDLKWPAVAVIVSLLLTLGFLSFHDKDVTAVLAGILAVLGALGFGYTYNQQRELQGQQNEIKQNTETIKEQTNGRLDKMMTMLERQNQDHRREMSAMADKLATMTPPTPEAPVSVSGGGVYSDTRGARDPSDL